MVQYNCSKKLKKLRVDLDRKMGTPARLYLLCLEFKDGQECPSDEDQRSRKSKGSKSAKGTASLRRWCCGLGCLGRVYGDN